MKPNTYHHTIARMLVANSQMFGYSKSETTAKHLRYYHMIPSIQDLARTSTEAQFFWKLSVCFNCGSVGNTPSTKLVVGVCRECYQPGQTFYVGIQNAADWLNREFLKLPTVHKVALTEALDVARKYIQRNPRSSSDGRSCDSASNGGIQSGFTSVSLESVPDKTGESASNVRYGEEQETDNSAESPAKRYDRSTNEKNRRLLQNIRLRLEKLKDE